MNQQQNNQYGQQPNQQQKPGQYAGTQQDKNSTDKSGKQAQGQNANNLREPETANRGSQNRDE